MRVQPYNMIKPAKPLYHLAKKAEPKVDKNILEEKIAEDIVDESAKGTKEKTFEELQAESEKRQEQMKKDLEASKQQIEGVQETYKIFINCLEISRRIMGGHKVPSQDHQYLLENDAALYGKAIMMRMPAEEVIEYDALTGEEKDDVDVFKAKYLGEKNSKSEQIPAEGGKKINVKA